MYTSSSRTSRPASSTTVAFDVHEQFVELFMTDKFDRVRCNRQTRDVQLPGSVAPVLACFSARPEAAQCSGREVVCELGCPFSPE